jgi:hypothetical protein
MIATGNQNGEVLVRNLLHPTGNPLDRQLQISPAEDVGSSELKLNHFDKDPSLKCEVTMVRFSVVKRYIMASAYQNGQIVIWDLQGAFFLKPIEVSGACRKFVFNAQSGKPCTGIAFTQVNHLLLTSCGMDN